MSKQRKPQYRKPLKRVTTKRKPDGTTYQVTRWQAKYVTPDGGKPSAGTFDTMREASDAIVKAMDEAWGDGEAGEPASRTATVEEYLPRWLSKRPRSDRSSVNYKSRIKQAIEVKIEGKRFGDYELRSLRHRHADELVEQFYKQGRNSGGVSAMISALAAMTQDAVRDEFCEFNPFRGLRIQSDDPRAIKPPAARRIWKFQAEHEFAEYAPTFEGTVMLRLLSDCGLRLGELLALEREHWVPGFIHVRQTAWGSRIIKGRPPKAGESPIKNHWRDIPLPPSTEELLRKMVVQLGARWLFVTPRRWHRSNAGHMIVPRDQQSVRWQEQNWRERVFLPTVEAANKDREGQRLDPLPREMRRSYVSNLRALGIDPADLAKISGHTVETAMRSYTEPLEESNDAIRRAIG
jgi:integrase